MQVSFRTYSGFSIIEVLVWIFIFSLGLISVYALLVSSLSLNERNQNSIIASNLAREQIELLRNIRDTNYEKLQVWNQRDPKNGSFSEVFVAGEYYTLENDFSLGTSQIRELGTSIPEWVWDILAMWNPINGYKLCLNDKKIYTYICPVDYTWTDYTVTPFHRYLYISDKELNDDGTEWVSLPDGALRVVSKVIWYKRGYHEFDIQTIITDWRRI